MDRRVEPEFLDELPAADPRAIRSRRDLRSLNAWMGNARIMASALRSAFPHEPPLRILELGTGDATFLLRVAQRLAPYWPGTTALLVDRKQIVTPETLRAFEKLGWRAECVAADVFDWLRGSAAQNCDAIIANLFLHHFSESQLSMLLSEAARQTRVFVAVEPRRWNWSVWFCRLLWLIRCNEITRHDAVVSVRAGFAGDELSSLWPALTHGASTSSNASWSLQERPANFASHLFVAERGPRTIISSVKSKRWRL
jgi:methyltransferase family protein